MREAVPELEEGVIVEGCRGEVTDGGSISAEP